MRIRIGGHYLYWPLLLLGFTEAAAVFASYCIEFRWLNGSSGTDTPVGAEALLFTLCVTVSMVMFGLFCQRLRDRFGGIVLRVALSAVLGGLLARLLSLMILDHWIQRLVLAGAVSTAFLVQSLTRRLMLRLWEGELFKRRVLVLGAGQRAALILRLRRRADQRGFRLIGFIPVEGERPVIEADRRVQGACLKECARLHNAREIVVAMDDRRRSLPVQQLLECRLAGIDIIELGDFLERETGKVFLECLNPSSLIFGGGFRRSWFRQTLERGFDLIVSGVMLIVGLPSHVGSVAGDQTGGRAACAGAVRAGARRAVRARFQRREVSQHARRCGK
jgi:hypothetical protein